MYKKIKNYKNILLCILSVENTIAATVLTVVTDEVVQHDLDAPYNPLRDNANFLAQQNNRSRHFNYRIDQQLRNEELDEDFEEDPRLDSQEKTLCIACVAAFIISVLVVEILRPAI